MSVLAPPLTDVVVTRDGERLFTGVWPGEEPTFVFAHGLTSTHRNIAAVAAELDGALRVVAPDLRGRGNSTKPPAGSYGMEAHARDVLDVMDAFGIERAIVGGHSMGAYVATAVAVTAPERLLGLVLIDGGVIVVPPGMEDVQIDPDVLMEQVLKPVMDRMRTTYPTVDAYLDVWRAMPYFKDGFGDIAEQYALYDLAHTKDGYASKCSETGATEDWRDLLQNPAAKDRLDRVRVPTLAVGAERGMTEADESVLSDVHVERLRTAIADVEFVRVPSTTHHTVTMSDHGAKATADALRKFAARVAG